MNLHGSKRVLLFLSRHLAPPYLQGSLVWAMQLLDTVALVFRLNTAVLKGRPDIQVRVHKAVVCRRDQEKGKRISDTIKNLTTRWQKFTHCTFKSNVWEKVFIGTCFFKFNIAEKSKACYGSVGWTWPICGIHWQHRSSLGNNSEKNFSSCDLQDRIQKEFILFNAMQWYDSIKKPERGRENYCIFNLTKNLENVMLSGQRQDTWSQHGLGVRGGQEDQTDCGKTCSKRLQRGKAPSSRRWMLNPQSVWLGTKGGDRTWAAGRHQRHSCWFCSSWGKVHLDPGDNRRSSWFWPCQ